MKPSGGLWGPVPGDSSSIKQSHPIEEDSFSLGASLTTEAALGDYTLKAGPWVLDLKGEPYTVMTGMSVQEFAHSEYLEGRVSFSYSQWYHADPSLRCPLSTWRPRRSLTTQDLQ
jgi:hypothetical protein